MLAAQNFAFLWYLSMVKLNNAYLDLLPDEDDTTSAFAIF